MHCQYEFETVNVLIEQSPRSFFQAKSHNSNNKLQTQRTISKVIPLQGLFFYDLDLNNHLRKTIEKPGVLFMKSTTHQCHVKTSKILLWNAQMSSLTSNSYRLCRRRGRNVPGRTATGTVAGKKLAGTQNIAELRSKTKTAASVYPNGSARWSKIAEKSQFRRGCGAETGTIAIE